MKAVRPDMPVGFNLAMQDDQPAPEDTRRDEPGCADRQANPPARLHTPCHPIHAGSSLALQRTEAVP